MTYSRLSQCFSWTFFLLLLRPRALITTWWVWSPPPSLTTTEPWFSFQILGRRSLLAILSRRYSFSRLCVCSLSTKGTRGRVYHYNVHYCHVSPHCHRCFGHSGPSNSSQFYFAWQVYAMGQTRFVKYVASAAVAILSLVAFGEFAIEREYCPLIGFFVSTTAGGLGKSETMNHLKSSPNLSTMTRMLRFYVPFRFQHFNRPQPDIFREAHHKNIRDVDS